MENKMKIGDIYEKKFQVTSTQILQFAKVSSDFNPIHIDTKFAQETPFKKPIAHGFLTASFISSVLGNDFPGKGTIYISQSIEFKAPVYANDIITVSIKLIENLGKNKYKLETTCINQNNTLVITGNAIVFNSIVTVN
jgi:3-hydroxybutyryl-CoA dehydratase